MKSSKANKFEQWKSNIYESIKSNSPSEQMLKEFEENITNIISTTKLLSPNEEFTDSFINDFCSKIVLLILSSNPPIDKCEILNLFLKSLILLYSNCLTNKIGNFVKTAQNTIFDSNAKFYRITSSLNKSSNFLQENIQTFIKANIIENATNFLNSNKDIDISQIFLFLSVFYPFRSYFNKKSFVDFYSIAGKLLQKKIHILEDDEIKFLNEKEISQSSIYVHQILSQDSSYSDDLNNLDLEMFNLSIKFAKSTFLSKQYEGLSTIRLHLTNSENKVKKKKKNGQRSNKIKYSDDDNDTSDANKADESQKNEFQHNLCDILYENKVVPTVIQNLHHVLVGEFSSILIIMLKYDLVASDNLQQLWLVTLKQHQSTIEIFLKAVENIMNFLNKNLTDNLWNSFAKSDDFPIQVLLFFQRIACKGSDENRDSLFKSLISYFKKNDLENSHKRTVLIETICSLTPEDQSKCEEMHQKCFEMMEKGNGEEFDYPLALLKASSRNISPKTAHESFHKLLETEKKVQNASVLIFLDPLLQLAIRIDDSLTDDEFNDLLKMTVFLVASNQKEVIGFYTVIFQTQNQRVSSRKSSNVELDGDDSSDEEEEEIEKEKVERINIRNSCLINHEKILLLIQKVCEIDPPPIEFIIALFEEVNRNKFCFVQNSTELKKLSKPVESFSGIDLIWNLNFKRNDLIQISIYLCNLYSKSEDEMDIKKYIKRCLNNASNKSSLITIRLLMDSIEWKFDKLSRSIQENKYYTKFDCFEISIIGYPLEKVRIPKLFRFEAFVERISCILDIQKSNFSIYVINNSNSIQNSDDVQNFNAIQSENICFDIFDPDANDGLVCVSKKEAILLTKENYSSIIKDGVIIGNKVETSIETNEKKGLNSKIYFPSLYLSKPKNFSIVFNFVKHNKNNELARIALEIVNRLPTSDHELATIRSETEVNPNWKRFFSLKNNHWCIFLYRLNLIGSLFEKGSELIDSFYMSGGSLWLSNILFNDAIMHFSSDEDLQLILEVALLLLKKIENKKLKKKMINSLGKDVADRIITLAIQRKDSIVLLQALFKLIFEFADVSPKVFVGISKFVQLFKFSIFHKNQQIRELITKTVSLISPSNLLKPIIKQLPKANNSYCDEYFSIMDEIADNYSDKMLQAMNDVLYSKYHINDNLDLIDKLRFVPPNERFTKGFFKVFDKVVTKNSKSNGDIFTFIVDNILFNPLKYYHPTNELFDILSFYLNRNQNLGDFIIRKIKFEDKNLNIAPIDHFSFVKHRGIKNLGATCYMNATIQALYNIHHFRYLILRKYKVDEIARMKEIDQEDDGIEIDDYYSENEIHKNEEEEEEEEDDEYDESKNKKKSIDIKFPDWFVNFKLIFAKLLLFPTDFIDISSFVKCWKWYDEPVNLHMQQDAAEFIQMLLDRIGGEIPMITKLFQGEICHETVGSNVHFRNQCKEKFVIFPLEVKGNSGVDESFQKFLIPDVFEGNDQYEAEELGKIDAKRFHWLSKAPRILILQLKRFSFDVKTGNREKIDDKYSFPLTLNLKTIMKSANKDNEECIDIVEEEEESNEEESNKKENELNDYFYDLIGIEMHTGDANGGHYFTICGPPCMSKKQVKNWYRFDDNDVQKIDSNVLINIANGSNTKSSAEENALNENRNAYLLFYKKRNEKDSIEQIEKEEEEKNENLETGIVDQTVISTNNLESSNTNSSMLNENSSVSSAAISSEATINNAKSANFALSKNSNINNTSSTIFPVSKSVMVNTNNNSIISTELSFEFDANNYSNENLSDETDSGFEKYEHKIDDEIISSVANEIKELVKISIMKNSDYSHFLMSIASTSNDLNFVYEFLMNSLKNANDKEEAISLFTKLKEIMDPGISSRFLNEKAFIFNDYLVKNENLEIRKICADAVISAISNTDDQFESYMQFIENYLPRSIMNWTRFDEFILPLVYIIEKKINNIDKKKWANILINFLDVTLKSSNNLQIYLLIKLDAVYRCLILLFESSSIRKDFESTMFNTEFLKPLFISRRNSKSLSCLIQSFIASPTSPKEENEIKREYFFSLIHKFLYEENEVNVICGVFSTFLFFSRNTSQKSVKTSKPETVDNDYSDDEEELNSIELEFDDELSTYKDNEIIENVLSILKQSSDEENEEFLRELILRIPYIQNKLISFLANNTNFWIINWLFNVNVKIRNGCCELLYKVFNEFPRLTFVDDNNESLVELNEPSQSTHQMFAKQSLKQIATSMYSLTKKFVEYSTSRLKNSYKLHCNGIDTFRMLPYRNFYELLKWSIVRTDSSSIILKNPKLLVNGMYKFKKIEKVNSDLCFASLRFIHSVVGIKNSKKFFKKRRFARKFVKVFSNATFDSINRYTSIETVSMIITLLPHHYSKYLFDTRFFRNSLEYCFSSISVTAPQLENFVIANAKLKSFAPHFWSDPVFNQNYKDSNYYLSLTANILTMKQKLSNLFFDLGRPKQIMKSLVVASHSSSTVIKSESGNDSRKNHFSLLRHKSKNIPLSETDENDTLIEEFTSVSAKQIEVLVAFLRAYQQYGKKPRSLLKLMSGLRNEIQRMIDLSLINNGNNVRTDVLLAIYKVLMQFFVMGPEFEKIVLKYVSNGLLANAREDVWSGAIELIRFICVFLNANQKESTAYSLALKELLSLKKPYDFRIVVELCDIITTPLFLYEPPVDGIVGFLNEIRNSGELPNPMPKEIKKLILTLRDKEAKGISKLVELAESQS